MKQKVLRNAVLLLLLTVLLAGTLAAKAIYPLNTDVTLTYWMTMESNLALVAKNMGDTEFAKELSKRTGVKVKFIHAPVGQGREALNLMIASGDLPDIIENDWYSTPGGPNNAIVNGVILKLNPVIDKYAPNLKSYLRKNPEYDRMVKTDEGNYYVFPFIRGDVTLTVVSGPIVRKDWLDELGLKVPTTADEWYTVLKAFKEKKGATAPLCLEYARLTQGFSSLADSFDGFYIDKGKVKYGGIEPNRKNYYTILRKWYSEGLLDNNFATTQRKTLDANILTGKSGASYGFAGSYMGRWMEAGVAKEPKFNLVGAPFPAHKKGAKPRFAFLSPPFGANAGSAAITTKCKNVEAAARYLDYAYSKQGHMLYNFGIENVSYKMVNGSPVYTELITNNPEKLSNTQVMSKYMRSHYNGPFVQDKVYIQQYLALPQQRDAIEQWKKNDYGKYYLPPVTPTQAESSELSKIMNDINTYTGEMALKFIMGVESLDKYDEYVAQVKKMGIDKAVAIYQAAYERYKQRK
jgi:putative aldouronate transport system substrate-binding protein